MEHLSVCGPDPALREGVRAEVVGCYRSRGFVWSRLEEDRTRQSTNVCLRWLIPALVGTPIQRSGPHAWVGRAV